MNTVQSAFSEDIANGFPGMIADGELKNAISCHLEGETACAFGRPVYQGALDRGVDLTVDANLVGFAVAQKGLPVTAARAADTYAPGDTLPVMERGKIWVTSTTTATKGQQVYVTSAGAISNSSSGNTAATGWEFDDTITAAGIVRIVRR